MGLGASATIVIVIACCGAFVCCLGAIGWVYHRQSFENSNPNHGWRPSNPQGEYMREVRVANQNGMLKISGRYNNRDKQQQQAMLSTSSLDQPSAVTYPSRSMSRSDVLSYDARSPDSVVRGAGAGYAEGDLEQGVKRPRDGVQSYDSYYTEYDYERYEQQYYDYPTPPPKTVY